MISANKKITGLFWLGILIVILPFIGIPYNWKEYAFFLFGVGVLLISSALQEDVKKLKSGVKEPIILSVGNKLSDEIRESEGE